MSEMVPEGWEIGSLGDYYSKLPTGMTPSRATPEYFQGDIPWVTSGELDFNVITSTKEKITAEAVKNTNLKIYPNGTIFIAITGLEAAGTRGRCAILGIPSTVNQSCMAFRNSSKIHSAYFFQYYLLNAESLAFKYSQGTKQQSFNTEIVKKFPIILPPLPEQKKIASILTSVDEVIETTQKQIDKLQDLKKATMNELLTKGIGHTEFKESELGRIPKSWEVKTLGEVLDRIDGGGTPSRENPFFWGDEIPWATVKDLTKKRLTVTKESITQEGLRNSSSNLVPKGTIIIATRMAVGKAAIFDKDVTINQDLKALYPKTLLSSEYLLQWFEFKSELIEALGVGSTVKGIRLEILRDISFLLPPLDEQIEISTILNSIEKQTNKKNQIITQTQSLKKSLMQDLLTGKVRVQVN